MYTVNDVKFKTYGKKIVDFDFDYFLKQYESDLEIHIPQKGNDYVVSHAVLEQSPLFPWLQQNVYGGLVIQIGTCAGHNKTLTAVEYHQGSEVVIALTDCRLVLGHIYDMDNLTYSESKMESFLIRRGEGVELFSTTLHYSPCELTPEGYATIVGLLKGTNEELEIKNYQKEQSLLLAKNKFMIVHSSRDDKIKKGAYPNFLKSDKLV